ncbi:TetR/AcrR family transcriptional regulator [Enterococcus sp. AZ196]|uniref:TetR/AcrR family transcriptional regulator n=1 Tax=Enterococcus sp. AZ196 TaxID=2774659 RepID=UPI003D2817AE
MVNNIIIDKEKIDEVAFEMVRAEGMDVLSARNIAKRLGCSTKPIYRIYKNMDDLKKVVMQSALQYMQHFVYMYKKTNNALLDSGLSYINFAKTEKELFKLISMPKGNGSLDNQNASSVQTDKELHKLVSLELSEKNYSEKRLNQITEHLTIYTYGLAIICFLGIQNFSEDDLAEKLKGFFEEISN